MAESAFVQYAALLRYAAGRSQAPHNPDAG